MLKIVYSLLSCDLYAKCLADLKVESDRRKKKDIANMATLSRRDTRRLVLSKWKYWLSS